MRTSYNMPPLHEVGNLGIDVVFRLPDGRTRYLAFEQRTDMYTEDSLPAAREALDVLDRMSVRPVLNLDTMRVTFMDNALEVVRLGEAVELSINVDNPEAE